jgi:aminoglycoside/choline kinase family phosphotransferase/dTDP-glucose pyrophosphorylase
MNLKKDDGYMKVSMIRTAFILGAGLGTRLRPLTEECPKPLLPVGGRPLITYAMDHCLTVGVERFIVNTHHCPAAYDRAFPERSWRGWPILFRHEPLLLDTAGGLKNIEDLLDEDETILVYNGDIISDLPLERLLAAHAVGKKEVMLALRSRGPVTNVSVDTKGAICDIRDLLGNPGVRRCLFTGIYIVEKRFLKRLRPGKTESVVPVFVEMLREAPGSVGSVMIDMGLWQDIGDPEAYARIESVRAGLRYEGDDRKQTAMHGEPAFLDALPGNGSGEDAAAFVRTSLDLPAETDIALTPVGQGGSDRDYFRSAVSGRDPFILMRYNRLREENNYYAGIARFLREIGVAVPAVFGHDPERGLLVMEDLGDEDLFALHAAPAELRRDLYEKTLRLAARLHAFPPGRLPAGLRLMPGFGSELYRWEREYFREQCVGKVCGIRLTGGEEEALEAELEVLARRLLETPPVLVHRDLQSQNVMIRKNEPVLIDFQGMRFGSPFYDLGSLLCDPYVEIGEGERAALLRYYYDLSRLPCGWEEFQERFLRGSAQRLMQALGAYGFLGRERGKSHFFVHIAPALNRLIDVTGRTGTLPQLHALARRCRASMRK